MTNVVAAQYLRPFSPTYLLALTNAKLTEAALHCIFSSLYGQYEWSKRNA